MVVDLGAVRDFRDASKDLAEPQCGRHLIGRSRGFEPSPCGNACGGYQEVSREIE